MVNLTTIRARVNVGLGRAASVFGNVTTQYRPVDPLDPLGAAAIVGTLQAAFDEDPRFGFVRPARYRQSMFHVLADATDLVVGDYLSGPDGVFFIVSVESVKAAAAVRTTATLALVRPVGGILAGANPPGGDGLATEITMLQGWPASMLAAGQGGSNDVNLPGDLRMGRWEVLLPRVAGAEIRSSDILVDQDAVRHVVMSAEASSLGWRIQATQEAT